MAEIKVRNNKYIFADDEFRVTSEDYESPEECYALSHDTVDALTRIGKGGKVRNHVEPTTLADDGYIDLPADSAGYGFILDTGGGEWAKFFWASDNTVTLMDNSTNVDDADTDGDIAIFDNTSSVRIRNRLGSEIEFLIDYHYTETSIAPTFRAFSVPSGVDNLDPYLTINGTTVTPKFRYKLGDADGTDLSPWGYGETLTRVSVATPPTYNDGSPGLGANDDSCKFNASDYYQKNSAAASQFTTGDMAFELIFKYVEEISALVRTRITTGISIKQYTSGRLVFQAQDSGGGTEFYSTSAVMTAGCFYHVMLFANRDENSDNGVAWYINGEKYGDGNISTRSGSLTALDFAIGAVPGGTIPTNANITYIAAWEQADWHQAGASGPAEWATVAAERFAKLCGYYPQIANGTYMPTTATRAFSAYVDRVENGYRKLYYVGSEWLRMCHRQDSLGEDVRGYLSETEAENLFTYSEEFTQWTKLDAGDTVTDNAAICPDGRTAACSIIADSTDGSHGVYKAATTTAATYAYSIFAKPGNKNWISMYQTTLGVKCYFDIDNGVVGTPTNCVGHIEGPFYSGDTTPYYRCCVVFTGTATVHNFVARVADSDSDDTIQGNGSDVNTYFWGAQIELGDYMTSPIRTSSAPATRVGDSLVYVAGDNIGGEDVGQGTVVFDGLFPSFDVGDSRYPYWIGDGGTSGDRIFGIIETTNDDFQIGTRASGGNNGDAATGVSVYDDTKHTFRHTYETDDTRVYMDSVLKDSDTSADIPDDVDSMYIGMNPSVLKQPLGLLQNLRIYAEPTLKG